MQNLMNLEPGDQFFVEFESPDENISCHYLPYKHKWLTVVSLEHDGRRTFYYAKYEPDSNEGTLIAQNYPIRRMRWFPLQDFRFVRRNNIQPIQQISFADDLPDI